MKYLLVTDHISIYSRGGSLSAWTNTRRRLISASRFNFKACTVARQVAVRPRIYVASSVHAPTERPPYLAKWWFQGNTIIPSRGGRKSWNSAW